MIKHVVMWKLKDVAEGKGKLENISLVKKKILGLKSIIAEIESLEIGQNFNSSDAAFDLVLITTHQDKDDLVEYLNHPSHQEVANFIGRVVDERRVVDFEYQPVSP